MSANGIPLKEHVEKLFDEFKERYLSDQNSRDKAFDDFKEALDKEGKLLADNYLKDLKAYPTVSDFNELQEKVTNDIAASLGRAKALAIGISLISMLISITVAVSAVLRYSQPTP